MSQQKINKIVLAYSGGLDTSVMLRWLKEQYGCEVVCYCADVGQGEELSGLEEKALATGGSKLYVEDLRDHRRLADRCEHGHKQHRSDQRESDRHAHVAEEQEQTAHQDNEEAVGGHSTPPPMLS